MSLPNIYGIEIYSTENHFHRNDIENFVAEMTLQIKFILSVLLTAKQTNLTDYHSQSNEKTKPVQVKHTN